jgi:alkylhydroperoxidase family enzyme
VPTRIASELDDALYYLRRGCEPCAERHFDLARRHGASDEQIKAVRAVAGQAAAGPRVVSFPTRRAR